jgi:hypothetical protein
MAKITSPYNDEHYIDVPDEWLGKHARRHDEAVRKAKDLPATWRDFTAAMALLDDWHLPGVPKNSDEWDFDEMSLPVMVWVRETTLGSYYECYKIPKNF